MDNKYYNMTLENVVELLTNTLNLTSVFYDIFLNPKPMFVTLEQYDDNNQLVEVTIPNRAQDRIISKIGKGNPEGSVEAPAGTMYIDSETSEVYMKVSGDDTSGWILLITENDISKVIDEYLKSKGFITAQYLVDNGYVTREDKATSTEAGVVRYDDLSITENDEGKIQTVGVIDQTNNVNRLWVGLKEEFDTITEKDINTIYIITDDSDDAGEDVNLVVEESTNTETSDSSDNESDDTITGD